MKCKICNLEFETIKDITEHLIKEHNHGIEDIYKYYNYSFDELKGTCPICGKDFKIKETTRKDHRRGLSKAIGCTRSCSRTLLYMLYPEKNPLSKEESLEKAKRAVKEKYGVDNVFQSSEIKEKIKKANLEKRGVEHPMKSPEVREKGRKTSLERYGVEYATQSLKFQEKAKKTNLEKYGTEYATQSQEIQEKTKKTNLEKYGAECVFKSPKIQEKIKKTNKERYGFENVFSSPEIKEKIVQTNIKKYGTKCPLSTPEVLEKARQTNREKYGVEYTCQIKESAMNNRYKISKINKKFCQLLSENNINYELELALGKYCYDIQIDNTLIEINPAYTHNSSIGPYFNGRQKEPLSKDYHLLKSKAAYENGYRCIHIFDWDDWNKIINLLLEKQIIYGRKCTIKEISHKQANEFLGQYHLQGGTKGIKYAYGLFYENSLVQVMTFGKPRYNRKYEYELLRLCTTARIVVIGGANKLLNYFEEQVNPSSIISYCDLSKFAGSVYEKLGFSLLKQTPPAKNWYNEKTKRHITDNLLRQRGFDQLHGTSYGKGTSNELLMLEHKYVEIYDCGQLVFVK